MRTIPLERTLPISSTIETGSASRRAAQPPRSASVHSRIPERPASSKRLATVTIVAVPRTRRKPVNCEKGGGPGGGPRGARQKRAASQSNERRRAPAHLPSPRAHLYPRRGQCRGAQIHESRASRCERRERRREAPGTFNGDGGRVSRPSFDCVDARVRRPSLGPNPLKCGLYFARSSLVSPARLVSVCVAGQTRRCRHFSHGEICLRACVGVERG